MKTQKKYEAPQTQHAEVELEQGFMKDSVFKDAEDSEALSIDNQVQEEDFNFSGENNKDWQWK